MPLPAGVLNGRIPLGALARLPWDEADHLYLEADAAASLGRLAAAFAQHFGEPLYVTDAYRTFEAQERLKRQKGSFAATPGRSNHGWGVAVDLASRVNVAHSLEHRWFDEHAAEYGWTNPRWAQDNNRANGEFEPWHWEYDPDADQHRGKDDIVTLSDDDRKLLQRVEAKLDDVHGAIGAGGGRGLAEDATLLHLVRRIDGNADRSARNSDGVAARFDTVDATLAATQQLTATIPAAVWSQELDRLVDAGTDLAHVETHTAWAWLSAGLLRIRDIWHRPRTEDA